MCQSAASTLIRERQEKDTRPKSRLVLRSGFVSPNDRNQARLGNLAVVRNQARSFDQRSSPDQPVLRILWIGFGETHSVSNAVTTA
jgi:hypothetical protein